MQVIYIPQKPKSSGRVFPIISQDSRTGNTRVIGTVNLDRYNSQFSPIVTKINIKEEYKGINMVVVLVLEALWERFGNYIISGEVELSLGLYKILTKYLGCKIVPDGMLFTKRNYETLMKKTEETIKNRK